MKTLIKLEVTAFVTSKEADAEKSASVVVAVDNTGHAENDWGEIVAKLILQATDITPDTVPFRDAKLMNAPAAKRYLDAQQA